MTTDRADAERLAEAERRHTVHDPEDECLTCFLLAQVATLRQECDDYKAEAEMHIGAASKIAAERDAAIHEVEALREEVKRLQSLLERASDKLCHYATDYPQPDTLSIINDCDRALARANRL